MKRFSRLKRSSGARQRSFDFLDRSRRHQRWFKLGILGRDVPGDRRSFSVCCPRDATSSPRRHRRREQAVRSTLGLPTPREEIDEGWRRFRLDGIADSQESLGAGIYAKASPGNQRLMRYAGLDPDHGLLRWGNFDRTLLLAVDGLRSRRQWPFLPVSAMHRLDLAATDHDQSGVLMFFLVPDGPDWARRSEGPRRSPSRSHVSRPIRGACAVPSPSSTRPLRGIVLGDSFMQGMFIGDDETPPECLRHDLENRLKTKVSILNTGHLGYSPEQYYYSLVEYADRFRPHFVVVSVFGNDFAATSPTSSREGKGDWDEGKYWLDKIISLCVARAAGRTWSYRFLMSRVLLGRRRAGHYPGTISNILEDNALNFLDPSDDLLDDPGVGRRRRANWQEAVRLPALQRPDRRRALLALGSKVLGPDCGPAARAVAGADSNRSTT